MTFILPEMQSVPARLLRDLMAVAPCDLGSADVLIGGTPCQSFSSAGELGMLNDARGNLALRYADLWRQSNIPFVVWENVPAVLNDASVFSMILSHFAGAEVRAEAWPRSAIVTTPDKTMGWRMLDAYRFAVPQKRRRLFLVASKRSSHLEDVVRVVTQQDGGIFAETDFPPAQVGCAGMWPIRCSEPPIAIHRQATKWDIIDPPESIAEHHWLSPRACRGIIDRAVKMGKTLPRRVLTALIEEGGWKGELPKVSTADNGNEEPLIPCITQRHPTTWATDRCGGTVVANGRLRMLTPNECERAQGFRAGYTDIGLSETKRYAAIGDSMAVPVIRWIGNRLANVLGRPFTFASVCSGIEAASVAWLPSMWADDESWPDALRNPPGHRAMVYVEKDESRRQVLDERWAVLG